MNERFNSYFQGKEVLILGYGLEGRSTVEFLLKYFPACNITVADRNPDIQLSGEELDHIKFILGETYLDHIKDYDLVVKSPGIPLKILSGQIDPSKLTSQTEIFLKLYREKIIGITGTKGKSTTSSLIYGILEKAGHDCVLLGNIGRPPLDYADKIGDDSIIVFEMSSHQLDGIQISPKYSVFLNLFEEHLDHYSHIDEYRSAKYNIFRYQKAGDWFVYNCGDQKIDNDLIESPASINKLGFSASCREGCGSCLGPGGVISYKGPGGPNQYDFSGRRAIPGNHNLLNIMAALCISKILEVEDTVIQDTIDSFAGLEHRLEYVGKYSEIHFYNDSIATIPEATIEAIKTLGNIDTLILGGKDRGISYSGLVRFLGSVQIKNIILVGAVGRKLWPLLNKQQKGRSNLFPITTYDELPGIILENTAKEAICLLSPAAPSYDMFRNFEERGQLFRQIVKSLD